MIDLKFDCVSKRYRVRQQQAASSAGGHPLLHRLRSLKTRSQDFWAIRDVSFGVERGEALGIIGHNGAGKSTILKLLAGITTPTSGGIMINGRLSALIEVGSGFHPELTGRENIYLSGSILGMRRREITNKLDSIVEFAEVQRFIDTPVKRYSSGMYVRLGFSIAAHLDPDILLLDEVLAVGDSAFQAKCLARIEELRTNGTTIIFISHDLGAVERLCSRALLMQRGELVASGRPRDVITKYEQLASTFKPSTPPDTAGAQLTKEAELVSLGFYDVEERQSSALRTGEPFTVRMGYTAHKQMTNVVFSISLYSEQGELCCQFTTGLDDRAIDLEPGTSTIEFCCAELGLQPGLYRVDAAIERYPEVVDWQIHCVSLRVDPGKIVRGNFYMPHEWRMVNDEGSNNVERLEKHLLTSA